MLGIDEVVGGLESLQSELAKLLNTRLTGADEERLERWYKRALAQLTTWRFIDEASRFEHAPYTNSPFGPKAENLYRQAQARREVLKALSEDISTHPEFYKTRFVLTGD